MDGKYFHATCSKKMFGIAQVPVFPYTEKQMEELAKQIFRSQISVTGVQPKLSLEIAKGESQEESKRFSIVGL
jgi:serine/threonine-protein kinase HipA